MTYVCPLASEIHLWQFSLIAPSHCVDQLFTLLDSGERERANRFHFSVHRERFIVAHAALRQILSSYLHQDPALICFDVTENGKPYLIDNRLTFNLSHSHERAVIAVTDSNRVGVDIEKIEPTYSHAVAERFFSKTECLALSELQGEEQVKGFYYLWAHKEALIKALGIGLSFPLSSFSVPLDQLKKYVTIDDVSWYLESFSAHSDYQAAFATERMIEFVTCFDWKVGENILGY